MKFSRRPVSAAVAATVAAALVFNPATAIQANAVTFNINGAPVADGGQALRAVAGAVGAVVDTGATFSYAGYSVVYDPRSLGKGLSDAFAPSGDNAVRYQTGRTADGRTVVTPTVGTFTSGFGPRWGRMHNGIDIANNIGTPIYAVMDGTVINAGPAQGFGNWVVIRHAGGEVSVYGHMRDYNVSVGQQVRAGEQIAKIGNEGHSTGPHLHFEIKPDGVNPTDPVVWFKQQGIRI
ncbi:MULTISPECIES: M23 family metallopeptidase [Corynebacterium]|uniref:M23 family metallopeptidase n=1 Tax=Corynebacterium TaxID=1716 RepID=UPI0008A17B92|nr:MULTISPECIES: M23 family metallopeptidase [Corynebacterium]OFT74465.1 peptidase M23 [Corynebacterium sp. HMSC30G07]PLA14263.1 M23 family peptidase [Corynebacterium riegelii]